MPFNVCGVCKFVRLFLIFSALLPVSSELRANNGTHLQKPMSIDDARHILTRTGFGASLSDALRLKGMTRQEAVDFIVENVKFSPDVEMPAWVEQPLPHYHAAPDMDADWQVRFNSDRNAEITQLRDWWVLNILDTTSPQTERLVLFWHDVFATSYQGLNRQTMAMARQNETFRRLGFGKWDTLLKAMIRDAALLEFLDAGSNHRESPNENLARELMELFVLGEGNYQENDVQEAARALTGHDSSQLRNLEFRLKTGAQDRQLKTLFGRTDSFDGDTLIDLLLEQGAAPKFLVTRFWNAFVSDGLPPIDWVNDQASQFRNSGFRVASLYKNVLESDAFWHSDQRGTMIKSPIDLVAGTARTLEYPKRQWKKMANWQSTIGMNLFAPPNVAGWTEGPAFITPGRLLNRFQIARQLTKNMSQYMSQTGDAKLEQTMDTQTLEIQSNRSDSVPQASGFSNLIRTTGSTASAVHVQLGRINEKNGTHSLEVILDHFRTKENTFEHVSFNVEKRNDDPMLLLLSSFSCWPDCVEDWPECARTDKYFPAAKHIALPWVASSDKRWADNFDHQCQFDSLSITEKRLVSTIWKNLPDLLSQAKQTVRVQKYPDNWLPIIDYLITEYNDAVASLTSTPYGVYATSLTIAPEYAPIQPERVPLSEPTVNVADISKQQALFDKTDVEVHELLLPNRVGDFSSANLSINYDTPDEYLQAVIESPLFQLK